MMKVPKIAAYVVLVVLFAAAVYMVYTADGLGGGMPATGTPGDRADGREPTPEDQVPDENGEEDEDTTVLPEDIGEWDPDNDGEFFVEYRLERDRVRSRELDMLQQMINNPNVSAESKEEAEKKLLRLQEVMEFEMVVENAIKAQGFDNVILVVQQDNALVIVDAKELSSEQILLIAEVASQSTGLRPSQINISNQIGK